MNRVKLQFLKAEREGFVYLVPVPSACWKTVPATLPKFCSGVLGRVLSVFSGHRDRHENIPDSR